MEKVKKIRKKKITKNKKEIVKNDSLIFAFLLAVFCILTESLKTYAVFKISFSVLVVPIVIFISDYITKKYGFMDSLKAILISGLIIVAFVILIKDLTNQTINFTEVFGPFITYFFAMILNLIIYYYIVYNMGQTKPMIFLGYVFVIMVFYLIYLLLFQGMVLTDNFWKTYFISSIISSLLSLIWIQFDTKIKRGLD